MVLLFLGRATASAQQVFHGEHEVAVRSTHVVFCTVLTYSHAPKGRPICRQCYRGHGSLLDGLLRAMREILDGAKLP